MLKLISKYQEGDIIYKTNQPLKEISISDKSVARGKKIAKYLPYLNSYQKIQLKKYYTNPDGTYTDRGVQYIVDVGSKNLTGQSNYMKDVNKLSYIPNAAMLTAGAFSGALINPYLWSTLGLASGIQNIKDKNYGEAALDIGLTALVPSVQLINKGVKATKLGKTIRLAREINKAHKNTKLPTTIIDNSAHSRIKFGDVEINNPNLMYHQQPAEGVGFIDKGAYSRNGYLYPRGSEDYTWWNLGEPWVQKYNPNYTRLLFTSAKNPNMIHVKSTPTKGIINIASDTEYISNKPLKATKYVLDESYGYRKLSSRIPTLKQATKSSEWAKKSMQRAYEKAIQEGNLNKVQQLRDWHFKFASKNPIIDENGDLITLYHGTPNGGWDEFKQIGGIGRATNTGFYSSPNKSYAGKYTAKDLRWQTPGDNPEIKELYGNGLLISERDSRLGQFPATLLQHTTPEQVSAVRNLGYEGIRSNNLLGKRAEINLFNGNNYKLRNAITYNENGKIIPLYERDNFLNNSLLYKGGGKL